jgi:hypothetical protein
MSAFGARADMRLLAVENVRFAPKSGHVRRNRSCLLWVNSGHRGARAFQTPAWFSPDTNSLAIVAQQPLSTSHFETRVYFMNLYVGMIFESLSEAFVNVRAALRPSDFLILHFRFARDRRLFKGNLVGFGQFCCVRSHRHK